jgi:two-component system, cell cycle sensor histidine kinase and response regulator CckA
MTILVVDNEKILIEIICRSLKHYGFETIGSTDPNEALKIINGNSDDIDLVITDLVMPLMNGHYMIDKISKIDKNIKFLVMTGSDEILDIEPLISKNIPYIIKPFTPEILVNVVKSIYKHEKT